jgi:hypothetical protein
MAQIYRLAACPSSAMMQPGLAVTDLWRDREQDQNRRGEALLNCNNSFRDDFPTNCGAQSGPKILWFGKGIVIAREGD